MVFGGMSSKAGFDTYDLFAYIIPGTLLLGTVGITLTHAGFAPIVEASLPLDGTFLRGVVLSVVFAMSAYIAGLVAHQVGKWLEGLPREGPPSATILEADSLLQGSIAEAVRSKIRGTVGTDEHSDQQLWELAYRKISLQGADRRVKQFQFLHTLSRGTFVIAALWIPLGLGYLLVGISMVGSTFVNFNLIGLTWLVLGSIVTPVMHVLRGRFDYAVAREVILAYYVSTVEPDL